jgi:hypothetical protein
MKTVFAVRVPRGEDAWYVTMSGRYVVWAGGRPGRYDYAPETGTPDSALHQLDVLDVRTRRVRVFPSARPDSIPIPLGISGDWLVWKEIVPQPRSVCDWVNCSTWKLFARHLVTDALVVLDASRGVEGGEWSPRGAVGEGYAVWLRKSRAEDDSAELCAVRLDGGTPHVLRRESGASALSISGGRVYWDRGDGEDIPLVSMPLRGGTVRDAGVTTNALWPSVTNGLAAWVEHASVERSTVAIADLSAPRPVARTVVSDSGYVSVTVVARDLLYADGSTAFTLVKDPFTARHRAYHVFEGDDEPLYPYAVPGGRLAFRAAHGTDLPYAIVVAAPA